MDRCASWAAAERWRRPAGGPAAARGEFGGSVTAPSERKRRGDATCAPDSAAVGGRSWVTASASVAHSQCVGRREASLPSYHVYQLDKYLFSTEYRDYLARELPDHMTFHFFDAPHQHDKRCQQVDLCILGIGQNGHIAFNEPPSDATSQTRVVELSPSTIESNAPPSKYALTLGIETILTAKQIVLMAKRNKQGVLKRVYRGESLPATCLAHHPNVTFVVER